MIDARERGTELGTVVSEVFVDGLWVLASAYGEPLLVDASPFVDDEPLPTLADAPIVRRRGRPRK